MSFKFEIVTKRLLALIVILVMALTVHNPAIAGPKSFHKMDADEDGRVSKKEFLAKVEKQFAKMDKNKNGVIESDEMMRFHEAKFKKMDRDDNGYLDKKDRHGKKMEGKKNRH